MEQREIRDIAGHGFARRMGFGFHAPALITGRCPGSRRGGVGRAQIERARRRGVALLPEFQAETRDIGRIGRARSRRHHGIPVLEPGQQPQGGVAGQKQLARGQEIREIARMDQRGLRRPRSRLGRRPEDRIPRASIRWRRPGRGPCAPRAGRQPTAAAKFDTPTAGIPAASARPRAAAKPMRMPVNPPGPVVTAIRSRSAGTSPASSRVSAIKRHQPLGLAALHAFPRAGRRRGPPPAPRRRSRARRNRSPGPSSFGCFRHGADHSLLREWGHGARGDFTARIRCRHRHRLCHAQQLHRQAGLCPAGLLSPSRRGGGLEARGGAGQALGILGSRSSTPSARARRNGCCGIAAPIPNSWPIRARARRIRGASAVDLTLIDERRQSSTWERDSTPSRRLSHHANTGYSRSGAEEPPAAAGIDERRGLGFLPERVVALSALRQQELSAAVGCRFAGADDAEDPLGNLFRRHSRVSANPGPLDPCFRGGDGSNFVSDRPDFRHFRARNGAACSRCRPSRSRSSWGSPSTSPACGDRPRRRRSGRK